MPAPAAPRRFHFKIDPSTPVKDLLPKTPKAGRIGPIQTDDLAQVPEILYEEPWELPKEKALERTAHAIAKVNHLNGKETDGFLKALLHERPDLAGLPMAMGDACRTKGERSREFNLAVATVRRALQQSQGTSQVLTFTAPVVTTTVREQPVTGPPAPPAEPAPPVGPAAPTSPAPAPLPAAIPAATPATMAPAPAGAPATLIAQEVLQTQEMREVAGRADAADLFWERYRQACSDEDRMAERRDRAHQQTVALARVAALMQVLAPESPGLRLGLVKYLAGVSCVEATRALAKLALFSAEDDVRSAAVDALQTRRERDYTEVLLEGFRYPWPAVAKRAAEALVKLRRQDLVPQLISLLDDPDPRLPVAKEVNGKQVQTVRELVRVNHHRNCLLCHAPGNTPTVSPEALTAAIPIPGEPMPPSSQGYNNPSVPDILVRVDVTYLRQDFSVLLPLADANPWPEMQRFDFLVRNRALTEEEARLYREKLTRPEPGSVPPHRRAALTALRELTGRDTAPTAEAWRKLLSRAETQAHDAGAG
jgi:hypothetical protein